MEAESNAYEPSRLKMTKLLGCQISPASSCRTGVDAMRLADASITAGVHVT